MTDDETTMRSLIDQVQPEIDRQHGRLLTASDELLTYVLGLVRPWQGRSIETDSDVIVALIFSRSIGTFGAAVELARLGFGDQVAMLNRSLFEDMVDIHWVTVFPELAMERVEQHHLHARMLLADAVRAEGDIIDEAELPVFDEEKRKELDKIFGPFGEKSWTGRGLYTRICEIEQLWSEGPGRDELHFYRRIVHRENNQTLHVSAFSMGRQITRHSDDGLAMKLGPSPTDLDKGLAAAFWTFCQSFSHVLDTFWDGRPESWEPFFAERWPIFRPLTVETMREAGRNELCPCGSGKKYKKCHGA